MTAAQGLLAEGDTLHETYRIDRLIGVGGTGEVYRAENVVSHRPVAIKILKPAYSKNTRFVDLMRRELLRDVNSEAVVQYYDLLKTKDFGGLHFLVMEYIEGPPLAKRMAEAGPIPPDMLLKIARRVAAGLKAAHAKGVFHRDIAPDNIILRDGDPERATLIDFGIAKDLRPDAGTVIGQGFAGKYEYAAPEQMDGKADGQSDIYALGATLLAAARGRAPETPADLFAIRRMKDEPVDCSDQPQPLRGLLERMLAPDRARRIGSAAELERAIAEAMGGKAGSAAPGAAGRESGALGGPAALRASGAKPAPERKAARAAHGKRKGRGALWALLGFGATAAVAAAVLLGPGRELVFGPALPFADIYRLSASRDGAAVALSGDAPSAEESDLLTGAATASAGGAGVENGLDLAAGEPVENWAETLALIIAKLAPLEHWDLDVVEMRATLTGEAESQEEADRIAEAALQAADGAGLQLTVNLGVAEDAGQLWSQVSEVLSAYRACGPLEVEGGAQALAAGGPVTVHGRVLDAASAGELRSALTRLLGDRRLDMQVEPLNRAVCRVISLLDEAPAAPLDIRYAEGADGAPVDGDAFPPDGNPVIDIAAPASLEGLLHVFVVGSDGEVGPLLPHDMRPENDLQKIGTVRDGRRVVRVAYPQSEASPEKRSIGFQPPFGANLVVAVVSGQPLYASERFLLESLDEFAPELAGGLAMAERSGAPLAHAHRLLTVRE